MFRKNNNNFYEAHRNAEFEKHQRELELRGYSSPNSNMGYHNAPQQNPNDVNNNRMLTIDSMGRAPNEPGYIPTTLRGPVNGIHGTTPAGHHDAPPWDMNQPAPMNHRPAQDPRMTYQNPYFIRQDPNFMHSNTPQRTPEENIPWYMREQAPAIMLNDSMAPPMAPQQHAPIATPYTTTTPPGYFDEPPTDTTPEPEKKFLLIVNHFLETGYKTDHSQIALADGVPVVMYWKDQVDHYNGVNLTPVFKDLSEDEIKAYIRQYAETYNYILKFNGSITHIPKGHDFGLSDEEIIDFYTSALIDLYDQGKLGFCKKNDIITFKNNAINRVYSINPDISIDRAIPTTVDYFVPKVEVKEEVEEVIEKEVEEPKPNTIVLTEGMQVTIGFVEIQRDIYIEDIVELYEEYCAMTFGTYRTPEPEVQEVEPKQIETPTILPTVSFNTGEVIMKKERKVRSEALYMGAIDSTPPSKPRATRPSHDMKPVTEVVPVQKEASAEPTPGEIDKLTAHIQELNAQRMAKEKEAEAKEVAETTKRLGAERLEAKRAKAMNAVTKPIKVNVDKMPPHDGARIKVKHALFGPNRRGFRKPMSMGIPNPKAVAKPSTEEGKRFDLFGPNRKGFRKDIVMDMSKQLGDAGT